MRNTCKHITSSVVQAGLLLEIILTYYLSNALKCHREVRNNIKVISVAKSELYECLSLTIELPSHYIMLLCGLYHPPRTTYREEDLLEYLTDVSDTFLEENPTGLVVCGGDLNRLDVEKLSMLSGLKPLVDFPTRHSAILDNCLTNNTSLFSKCYPFIAQIN